MKAGAWIGTQEFRPSLLSPGPPGTRSQSLSPTGQGQGGPAPVRNAGS